jgi:hypothetical protein
VRVLRASAVFCVLVVASLAGAGDKSHSRYPNELQGFEFYPKYLTPLQPGRSSTKSVRRVLGDTAAVKRGAWTINTTYTTRGGSVNKPELGPLHEIIMRSDAATPMAAVKFSASFAHCHASVSEFNISFDVYSDPSGLEYWLHEEDSKWGKKADLFQIVYGVRRQPHPPHTICLVGEKSPLHSCSDSGQMLPMWSESKAVGT